MLKISYNDKSRQKWIRGVWADFKFNLSKRSSSAFVYFFLLLLVVCLTVSTIWILASSFQLIAIKQSQAKPSQIIIPIFPHEFAYTFYVTNANYMCSAMVALQTLIELKVNPLIDIAFIMPPNRKQIISQTSMDYLLKLNQTRNGTIFIKEQTVPYKLSHGYYNEVHLKLTAFTLYNYKRVIQIDSDAFINKNLDHLFWQLPQNTIVASPHAHWLEKRAKIKIVDHEMFTTSVLLVIKPDEVVWKNRIQKYYHQDESYSGADMDLINEEFQTDLLTLPHQYVSLDAALETDEVSQKWYGKDVRDAISDLFIIHFTAHKPWSVTIDPEPHWKKNKHPIFFGLYEKWHSIAENVC